MPYLLSDLNRGKVAQMYISLADSRATGFKKWADAHRQEKFGDARAGEGEDGVTAAPDLDQGVITPAEHRP